MPNEFPGGDEQIVEDRVEPARHISERADDIRCAVAPLDRQTMCWIVENRRPIDASLR